MGRQIYIMRVQEPISPDQGRVVIDVINDAPMHPSAVTDDAGNTYSLNYESTDDFGGTSAWYAVEYRPPTRLTLTFSDLDTGDYYKTYVI